MLRLLGLVVAALVLSGSAREASAWPSPANWGCGWYGSVRPAHCNVGWGCGPSFCGPSFCGPALCGPRFYGVAGWSVGSLNFTYQGFAPAWGWGMWAPAAPVPFFVQQPRRNLLIAARPAAAGQTFAQRAAPAQPHDSSSAARPAESIAALRAARRAENADRQLAGAAAGQQEPANPLVDDLVLRADKAAAAGKIGVARLYLQMAFEESAGAHREAVRAKLAQLDEPVGPARVAGGEGAAVR